MYFVNKRLLGYNEAIHEHKLSWQIVFQVPLSCVKDFLLVLKSHLILWLEAVKIQDVDCEGGRERSLRGFGALSPQHCDAAEAKSCLWKAKSIRPIQRPDPRNTIDMGAVGANMGRYAQKGFWLLRSNFWWHRRVSKRALIGHDPWFKWNAFSSGDMF